jgi:hypothetical protein
LAGLQYRQAQVDIAVRLRDHVGSNNLTYLPAGCGSSVDGSANGCDITSHDRRD